MFVLLVEQNKQFEDIALGFRKKVMDLFSLYSKFIQQIIWSWKLLSDK